MNMLKDIIGSVISDISTKRRIIDWPAAWGDLGEFTKGTAVVDFNKGTLIVNVDSSARVLWLKARTAQIKDMLKTKGVDIQHIQFKVGKV